MSESTDRSLSSRLFGWARRDAAGGEGAKDAGPAVGTKVIAKFLAALANRESPIVLDLGPVVGSNVSFLGEQLGCRLRVEDLFADVERLTKAQQIDTLPEFLEGRFSYEPESVDAVLCWDVLDYLDKPAATVLARKVVEWVKPGGVVLCFFNMAPSPSPLYTRYVIADTERLQYRTSPAAQGRKTIYQNRDIDRLFAGLAVSESFLLQHKVREVLLRKKAPAAPKT
ncbi:MAG TPA: class I SAM-dependent methyltransferase [Luteitalea sp.]|nr:class I SAM-dependent methyltransferase [Luteitalea sp.]